MNTPNELIISGVIIFLLSMSISIVLSIRTISGISKQFIIGILFLLSTIIMTFILIFTTMINEIGTIILMFIPIWIPILFFGIGSSLILSSFVFSCSSIFS